MFFFFLCYYRRWGLAAAEREHNFRHRITERGKQKNSRANLSWPIQGKLIFSTLFLSRESAYGKKFFESRVNLWTQARGKYIWLTSAQVNLRIKKKKKNEMLQFAFPTTLSFCVTNFFKKFEKSNSNFYRINNIYWSKYI